MSRLTQKEKSIVKLIELRDKEWRSWFNNGNTNRPINRCFTNFVGAMSDVDKINLIDNLVYYIAEHTSILDE